MPDSSVLDFLRVPANVLIALDNRPYHFAMQPYHYVIRATHVVAMAAFFGGIGFLDLRLIRTRSAVPLKGLADHFLPWLYAIFGITVATGVALFMYDPVHVGSHAYFTLKLVLTILGLANAAVFHRIGYAPAIVSETGMPIRARVAGTLSLTIWIAVVVCACLNVEAAPKVLLR